MTFLPEATVLVAYSVACFVLFITPGPDMSLFLAKTVSGGRKAGIAAMLGAVALLSDWSGRGLRFGGVRRERKSGKDSGALGLILLVVWIVAVILAPLIGQALAMMVSRQREYLADASAAELTRNPLALARALTKIDAAEAPTAAIKRGTAHLCIADPLGRSIGLREGTWANLMASHPPMKNRIAALNAMGFQ